MIFENLNKEQLQKLFFFSLKKTGNPHDAEELVQETALEIIRMLRNGYKPENFNAWMWTVARKRYARWCKNKRVNLSRYEIDDVLDYAEISSDEGVEDSILRSEDINLLRRELALMTKDYRDIVVSYYFDNKKIGAIATMTGLPEGTVKRKLYEARKHIKEGMKMARTKGQRSYAPEEIHISYYVNYSPELYPLGRPWNLMKRLAAKNIALEAYNNPSTVEELSLALGFAAPYIEDELAVLLENDVMVKHPDGRLETNFIIFNAETQRRILTELMEETGAKISPEICAIINKNIDKIRGIGFTNHDMPKEYLYWCLLHITLRKLQNKLYDDKNIDVSVTKRRDGGVWDIVAYEEWDQPINYASSSHNTGYTDKHNNELAFSHYTLDVKDVYTKDSDYSMSQNELQLYADIIKNGRTKSSLNNSEMQIFDVLVKNHVVHISGDEICVRYPVFDESGKKQFSAYHEIVREVYDGKVYRDLENLYKSMYDVISNSVPKRFKKDGSISKSAAWLDSLICILMRYAYENGIVKIPDGEDKSAVTMYFRY